MLAFLSLLGYRNILTPMSAEVAMLFAKSSAVFNPLVYSFMNPKFRVCLFKKLPFLTKCLRLLQRPPLGTTVQSPALASPVPISPLHLTSRSNAMETS
nr:unnamed protein product [Spirometra erinaceieuropaei]